MHLALGRKGRFIAPVLTTFKMTNFSNVISTKELNDRLVKQINPDISENILSNLDNNTRNYNTTLTEVSRGLRVVDIADKYCNFLQLLRSHARFVELVQISSENILKPF